MTPCRWFRYDDTENRFAVVMADYFPMDNVSVIETLRIDGIIEPIYVICKTTAGPS